MLNKHANKKRGQLGDLLFQLVLNDVDFKAALFRWFCTFDEFIVDGHSNKADSWYLQLLF